MDDDSGVLHNAAFRFLFKLGISRMVGGVAFSLHESGEMIGSSVVRLYRYFIAECSCQFKIRVHHATRLSFPMI